MTINKKSAAPLIVESKKITRPPIKKKIASPLNKKESKTPKRKRPKSKQTAISSKAQLSTPKVSLPQVKVKKVILRKTKVDHTSSASFTGNLIVSGQKLIKISPKPIKTPTEWLANSGKLKQAKYIAKQYRTIIEIAAKKYNNVDRKLIIAVMAVESGGDSLAVSPKDAKGLMMLMPTTAKSYGVKNVFNPQENVMAGAHHLSDLIKAFGNIPDALYAYNYGESGAQKRIKKGRLSKNEDYIKIIACLYSQINF